MRDVAIVGAGITPCRGRWVEKTYYGLAQMGVRAALEDAKRRVDTEVVQFNRQIVEIREDRDARAAAIPAEVMTVYDKVVLARGASAVAPVTEGYCQGCYMTVTTQDVALILKGNKLQQCKTCQRILYVPNPGDWITDA